VGHLAPGQSVQASVVFGTRWVKTVEGRYVQAADVSAPEQLGPVSHLYVLAATRTYSAPTAGANHASVDLWASVDGSNFFFLRRRMTSRVSCRSAMSADSLPECA